MKTFSTFFNEMKAIKTLVISFLFFANFLVSKGQVTATEDFEAMSINNATSFTRSGIQFNLTNFLRGYRNSSPYGANDSFGWMETPIGTAHNSANVGSIQIVTAATSFRVNSCKFWISSTFNPPTTRTAGAILFTGTKPDGLPVTQSINIGTSPVDSDGWFYVDFTTTNFNNIQLTQWSFTLPAGIAYFSADDFSFTTAAISTNQYSINDRSFVEGNSGTKTFDFTVSRTESAATGSVTVATSNGTATAGTDYVAINPTVLNFAIGESSKTVNVTVNGDLTVEDPNTPNTNDETFNVNLSSPSGGTISDAQGVGTIQDDDNIIETFETETTNNQSFTQLGFNFSSTGALLISNGTDLGNGGSSRVLDTRVGNGNSTGNVGTFGITNLGTSFNIRKIDVFTGDDGGTAANNIQVTFTGTKADGSGTVSHIATTSGLVGFPNPRVYFPVNFTGTAFDGVQLTSISINLGAGAAYISFDNFRFGTGSVVAANQLTISDVSILEGTGPGTTNAVFTVSRSLNNTNFSVNVALSHITSDATDLVSAFTSTNLNFLSGGGFTQTVTVPISRDATAEPNEVYNMTLSNPTNGALLLDAVGVGTINDDDGVIETYEDESNNATTFTQNSVSFSASNNLIVHTSVGSGSGSSNNYLDTGQGNGASSGSVGIISISSPNKAFKLIAVDGWTSNNDGNTHATGVVTFKATLFGGGTVQTNKTITPTASNGSGWQQNISFTGTPLENQLLTSLEMIIVSGINYIAIDNFSFTPVDLLPIIELADAGNVPINNNVAASITNNTDFGSTCVTGGIVNKTYTIKNSGLSNLVLPAPPNSITLGGNDANQFSILNYSGTPISPGGNSSFSIKFDPTSPGIKNATLTITSNDATNSPFVINIKGTGNTNPDATITANNAVCQLATLNLSAPAGASTYVWSGEGVVLANANTTTAVPFSISSQTYKVTVTAANTCTAIGTKTVTINAKPNLIGPASQTICKGTSAYILGECVYNVYTTLSGANERPTPNASTATGIAYGTFNTLTNQLSLNISFSGLTANASAAHIHGSASANINNAVGVIIDFAGLFPAATSGAFTYNATISATHAGYLLAGNTYVNIHSSAFPGGEIRGQLTASCAADVFTWNPGNISGIGTTVSPLIGTTYTLTATNSTTGCSNTTSTTVNVDPVTLPNAATTNMQTVGNVPLVANGCEYVTRVVPTTGFTVATVKSWIEPNSASGFVPRHYEITPSTNPGTATGTVTLFFKQSDFDTYNGTITSNFLPSDPMDLGDIVNFQLNKYAGTSATGLGYTGAPTLIPGGGNAWNTGPYTFVWNAANSYWEVTFPVNGFSGFLAKSVSGPLPVNLISFTGKATEKGNELTWKTSNEKNFSHFEIQRSSPLAPSGGTASNKFENIGEVSGSASETYEFLDASSPIGGGGGYYRLKMIDLDGLFSFSKIIFIENKAEKAIVGNFYPNPSSEKVFIDINSEEKGNWQITSYDLIGKLIKTESLILEKGTNKVVLEKLNSGVNFVRFTNGKISEIRKLLQQ